MVKHVIFDATEYGIYLAEFTINPEGALAIRQLASVLLKQYVEAHWSSLSEKFSYPETTDEVTFECWREFILETRIVGSIYC